MHTEEFKSPFIISNYPNTPRLHTYIDVIIPYNVSDRDIVQDAVRSILLQTNVTPIIHLVADNRNTCLPYYIHNTPVIQLKLDLKLIKQTAQQLHNNGIINHYITETNIGPYNIVNALVPNLQTEYIAIQDADDISISSRLWKQIAQLQLGFECTSCAMTQEAKDGYTGRRHLKDPIIYPGDQFTACPGGRHINSTRTMRKDFFIEMNGFKDIPCTGDFQFDNRCTLTLPPRKFHGSHEVLAIRRLRPQSLSNGGPLAMGEPERNKVASMLIENITTLRSNPTHAQAYSLGSLHSEGYVPLSPPSPSVDRLPAS